MSQGKLAGSTPDISTATKSLAGGDSTMAGMPSPVTSAVFGKGADMSKIGQQAGSFGQTPTGPSSTSFGAVAPPQGNTVGPVAPSGIDNEDGLDSIGGPDSTFGQTGAY